MTNQHVTRKKAELLAPAGSLEAFFAAMEKGADAVYAGLREFSARAKAKNFTLPQMERMTAYAHGLDRKVYVTLNTLVKEDELPGLVETLAALEAMEVDGVILQDLAVARLARNHFPGLALHASTQMTIHNSLGVNQLEELGFERVVLARELHLDEIREIAGKCRAEIECFVHGALCFSVSGQCYFSSYLGGHSGNRGRCTQPCRRLYRYRGKEGYYFSPNDFSSIDLIPQLVDAGVASLKIEGRMKSAEYVACVVEAYRRVLDAAPAARERALAEARELLKLSFGRTPTKGFLASHNPPDITTPSHRGATGRFLGEIARVAGNRITFESRDRLHVGDRVRIQPKSDMAGKGFTVKELFVNNRPVKAAGEKSLVTVVSPFPAHVKDAMFKVSSETAFTMSESACRKRLEGVKGSKLPCDLVLSFDKEVMRVAARAAGREVVEILRRKFGVVGDHLHAMGLGIDDSPVVPPDEEQEVKSVGHSMTLEHDISSRNEVLKYLLQLAEMVGRRARRYGVAGKTVHLTVRYADFSTFGRQQTRPAHTNRSEEIFGAAVAILDSFVLTQPVRLLGVRITNLRYQGEQLPLFTGERRKVLATGAMDLVNNKFGDFTVTYGSILDNEEKGSHVISPAWRPDGIRCVDVD